MELTIMVEAFDGRHLGAFGLDAQHQARADRFAVDDDGAGPADTVLATEVGAGEIELLSQNVGQGLASLNSRPHVPRR